MFLLDVIKFARIVLDIIIDSIFGFYYSRRSKSIPEPTNPLLLESASVLAKNIREKYATSEEVVRVFVEQIRAVNPLINAVTDERFEDALQEAQLVDERIAAGKVSEDEFRRKPFLGVPFTAKDTTACEGMKNTFGVMHRKDVVATYDADAVILMKKAGAILLGVTNVSQLDLWQETVNSVFGITNNPYNLSRTVGGSSGGSAAVTAACGSPLNIGTDIGGSLRLPAFMCGVFGHKPTNGLISTKGIMYRTGKEGPTMVTIGTFTKHSLDIAPFLKVLLDANASKLKLDEEVNIKDVKIYYILDVGDIKLSPLGREMKEALSRTIGHFEKVSGTKPQQLSLPNVAYGGNIWRYWMTQEAKVKFEKKPSKLTLRAYRSRYTPGTFLNLLNHFLPEEDPKWARKVTDELKEDLEQKLGTNGVLLYPSAPWSARCHHTALLRPWNFYYFAIWNALKMPVTQVPLGLDSEGLPVGVQVVASPLQDHLCIAVAKELEKAFGGFAPPSTCDKPVIC